MSSFPASILILWIVRVFCPASADLNNVLPMVEVVKGKDTVLPCATSFGKKDPVKWQRTPFGSQYSEDIFRRGFLELRFENEYKISENPEKGEYNLTIKNAEMNDAGTYACIDMDGEGEEKRTALIVYDSEPVGSSNVSLSHLSICDDKADGFSLSCNLTYTGDENPAIKWFQVFANGTEVEIFNGTSRITRESASFQLVVRVNPGMNSCRFRCQTKQQKYNWTSPEVQVQYVLANATVNPVQEVTKVSCKANSNQHCTYRWISTDTDTPLTDSDTLDLSQLSPGQYICTAECTIRNAKCTVDAMVVSYSGSDNTWTGSIAVIVGTVLGIVVVVTTVFCLTLYFKRKHLHGGRASDEKDETAPLLKNEEKFTPTPEIEKLIIRGISEMNKRIYVIFQERNFIRVFKDLEKFEKEDDIPLSQLEDPWDSGSCEIRNSLYIADRGMNNCIWELDLVTKKPRKCISDLRTPHKFSVTLNGMILIPKWPSQVEIVDIDTLTKKTIELPNSMKEPYDAKLISPSSLVVGHGHQKSMQQRVCLVEQDDSGLWTIQWSYPSNGTDKINNIDEMVLDEQNILYVTDQNNQRVLLLDMKGNCLNVIKLRKLPYRLCYSRNYGKLLIGHHGAISIYDRQGTGEKVRMQYLRTVVCESHPLGRDSSSSKTTKTNPRTEWIEDIENPIPVGDHVVSGMAELKERLYVVMQDQSAIKVFDCRKSFKELPAIETEEDPSGHSLSDPWFIDSCALYNRLYVTDRKRKCVIKITNPQENPEIGQFKLDLGDPYKLAVTSDGQILIPNWPLGLEIYNTEDQLVRTIHLPEDVIEPCHAIEMEKGTFIVGHGDKKSGLHRICTVKWSQKTGCRMVWSYGDERGNKMHQLNRPRNVITDGRGRIFVTDEGNRRIIQLNKDGKLLSMKELSKKPERIFYSPSADEILVGGYGFIERYSIDELNQLHFCL